MFSTASIASESDWFEAVKQSRLGDIKNAAHSYAGAVDNAGETGLMLAARLGYESLVSFLLPYESGQFNLRGETALIIAMQAHKLKIVQLLAPREASVKLEKGGSALHYAVIYEYLDSIPILAKYLKDVPDPEGLLPLELAVRTENFEATVDLLYYGQPHSLASLTRARSLLSDKLGANWTREFDKYMSAAEDHYLNDSDSYGKVSEGGTSTYTGTSRNSYPPFFLERTEEDALVEQPQPPHSPTSEDYGALGAAAAAASRNKNKFGNLNLHGTNPIIPEEDDIPKIEDVVEPDLDFPVRCEYDPQGYSPIQETVNHTVTSPSILTGELMNYENALLQQPSSSIGRELEMAISDARYEGQHDSQDAAPQALIYDPVQPKDIDAKSRQEELARKAEMEDTRYKYFEKDIAKLTASVSRTRTANDVLQLLGSSTTIEEDALPRNKFVPDITASQRVVSPRGSMRASSGPRSPNRRTINSQGFDASFSSRYSNVEKAGSRLSGSRTTENLLKDLVTSRYLNGDTELIYSVKHKNLPMVDQLAPSQHGERDADGKTALHLAAERNNKPMIDILAQYEAGMFDNDGWTALMRLAAQNAVDSVWPLLDKEARLQRAADGWTALMIAVMHADLEMVKILEPYEVGMQAHDGSTALILAIKADRPSVATFLFQKERHICDKDGISGEQWGINLNRPYIKAILVEEARKREEQMSKKRQSVVLPKYVPRSRITKIEARSPRRSDAMSDGYRLPSIWLNEVD